MEEQYSEPTLTSLFYSMIRGETKVEDFANVDSIKKVHIGDEDFDIIEMTMRGERIQFYASDIADNVLRMLMFDIEDIKPREKDFFLTKLGNFNVISNIILSKGWKDFANTTKIIGTFANGDSRYAVIGQKVRPVDNGSLMPVVPREGKYQQDEEYIMAPCNLVYNEIYGMFDECYDNTITSNLHANSFIKKLHELHQKWTVIDYAGLTLRAFAWLEKEDGRKVPVLDAIC